MPRYAEPYTLYPRKMKDGRTVYYYRARDPETGERTTARSTGKTTKREAYLYCNDLIRKNRLYTGEVKKKIPTLSQWTAEYHWWEWTDDGPSCRYCQNELKRSAADAPKIQRHSADECRSVLVKFLLPAHGKKRLDRITPTDIESLMQKWSDDGKSPKTINNRASVYRVMLAEAKRIDLIKETPFSRIKPYYIKEKKKGCLTKDEYVKLMSLEAFNSVWDGNLIGYGASLLASVTGLRLSEILALKGNDIHNDHITVKGAWFYKYGVGLQKTKRGVDEIPIPSAVYSFLEPVLTDDFVFSLQKGRPVTENYCRNCLYSAMVGIGIDKETRGKRNITFHSWRVFCNTYFRDAGVPDSKIRSVTRHETEAMTEHYTSFNLDDFKEVSEAQALLMNSLGNFQSPGV